MTTVDALDLAVIGGGSAGVRCARTAATLGAKVVLFEEGAMGGTCVNLGCIPKKLLAYGGEVAHQIDDARAMGWEIGAARLDWPTLVKNKDREIARLNGAYEGVLTRAGVEIVRGRATLEPAMRVRANDRVIEAKHIVIATGGKPRRPSIPGAELGDVSDDFFHWPALPRSCVVVGGGYVAVEIASVLHALGVSVDLVVRSEVLSSFDPSVSAFLGSELRKSGMRVREHAGNAASVAKGSEGLTLATSTSATFTAERVLFATGRTPHVVDFGLDAIGVKLRADGAIAVDAHYATTVPNVYAIGDVTSHVELTPVALAEGMLVARRLFGSGGAAVPYEITPTAVFSMPPVASAGLTEPTARLRGIEVRVFQTDFRPLKQTLTSGGGRTFMKLVVDAASDRVLGIHVVGIDAPEMIQGFAVALTAGVTKAQIDATIGVHPTSAEELVTMRG